MANGTETTAHAELDRIMVRAEAAKNATRIVDTFRLNRDAGIICIGIEPTNALRGPQHLLKGALYANRAQMIAALGPLLRSIACDCPDPDCALLQFKRIALYAYEQLQQGIKVVTETAPAEDDATAAAEEPTRRQ